MRKRDSEEKDLSDASGNVDVRKLYRVEIEMTLFVIADSASDAELDALCRYMREEEPDYISVDEVTGADAIPGEWLDSFPWGADNNRTIRELLAEREPEPFVDTLTPDMFAAACTEGTR